MTLPLKVTRVRVFAAHKTQRDPLPAIGQPQRPVGGPDSTVLAANRDFQLLGCLVGDGFSRRLKPSLRFSTFGAKCFGEETDDQSSDDRSGAD